MGGGAWWAAVDGVTKSRTWLSDFTFTFHFHALEKEMATHSSVLAWRIPGMGEPGGCCLWGRTDQTRLKWLSSRRVSWVFSVVSTQSDLFQFNRYLLSCICELALFLLLWVQLRTKLMPLVYDLLTLQWRRKAINWEGGCVNIDGAW